MKYIKKNIKIFIFSSLTLIITFMVLLAYPNFIEQQKMTLFQNVHSTPTNNFNFDPSQFNKIEEEIYRESIAEMLPANIELQYNGSTFDGNLVSYKYREGYSFSTLKKEDRTFDTGEELISIDLPFIKNLTNYISNNVITVTNGSELKFRIMGYPERMEPSSLSINSYKVKEDNNNGKTLQNPKVLHIVDNQNEAVFNVNLSPGKYLFVATATTIADTDEQVSGYVIYAYNIYIK